MSKIIEWDDIEQAYLSNTGITYKTLEDIPEVYRQNIKPKPKIPTKFYRILRPNKGYNLSKVKHFHRLFS